MFSKAAALSLFASSAFATVFITSPTQSIGFTGGQQATISWQDDGKSPSLADFGDAKVSIYTGNANQQTLLQEVTSGVNVATTASIQFVPDASIGPNGDNYFIRVESLNLKDSANTAFPALAFSSRFTMSGMSGTFNATIQAQIDGQSTAPIGGTTAAGSSTSASTHVTTTSSSSSATKAGNAAAAATSAKNDNGAVVSGAQSWMGVLVGVVAISLML
ncbi:hypothetical protein K435DRAFT_744669 [Dendrothele bispora CBS 962.96]|uniref:Yeast cell wall synthesis Kre9/Knh1-like N-terminal domain-containing protein n=1 Tax=Dendrothele bispora (strain CBS 962.96) TaxID=1314807 RepID=A0A4S8MRU4_DENBC|nr:hypothetical protein K435DRAFT_744669 [Dendrothele bispora CBS 962.96]